MVALGVVSVEWSFHDSTLVDFFADPNADSGLRKWSSVRKKLAQFAWNPWLRELQHASFAVSTGYWLALVLESQPNVFTA